MKNEHTKKKPSRGLTTKQTRRSRKRSSKSRSNSKRRRNEKLSKTSPRIEYLSHFLQLGLEYSLNGKNQRDDVVPARNMLEDYITKFTTTRAITHALPKTRSTTDLTRRIQL